MAVFFRLLWAIIRARFLPRVSLLDESSFAMRVWPNDVDLNVHMTSGRYISMMDIGRVTILARARLLPQTFGRGWRPIVSQTTIRYRRSLLPFQRFVVRSRVVCWDEKWLYFRHVMEHRGEVCAVAYVRGLMRGKEGNIAPAQLLEAAGMPGMPSPPMPAEIATWISADVR